MSIMAATSFRSELLRIPLLGTPVNRPSFERRWASFCGMLGGVSRVGHNRASSGPMTQRASTLFKTGWISLAIIGVAILAFGLITTAVPASSDPPYMRAIGVASIGMGLF